MNPARRASVRSRNDATTDGDRVTDDADVLRRLCTGAAAEHQTVETRRAPTPATNGAPA